MVAGPDDAVGLTGKEDLPSGTHSSVWMVSLEWGSPGGQESCGGIR